MRQKELDKEGITKEFLATLSVKALGNPVQLLPNDEPINLLKCASGFWVTHNGELLKNEKYELLVISDKDALIGRARYLINFKEQIALDEQAEMIEDEVQDLIQIIKDKVSKFLRETKLILQLAGKLESDTFFVLQKQFLDSKTQNNATTITEAKKLANSEGYFEYYNMIKDLYEKRDYDSLYIKFLQDGYPIMGSFTGREMDTLTKFFHRDKIAETAEKMKTKSHIEMVAEINVAKRQKSEK